MAWDLSKPVNLTISSALLLALSQFLNIPQRTKVPLLVMNKLCFHQTAQISLPGHCQSDWNFVLSSP